MLEGPKSPSALDKFDKGDMEAGEDVELDLTPGALEKTNDPVRMYLREMGTVPLLTREGEVEIAKRIERGQLRVLKALSRSPIVIREIIAMGEDLKRGVRSIKEVVLFDEDEITEEVLRQPPERHHRPRSTNSTSTTRSPSSWWRSSAGILPKKNARLHRKTRWVLGREQVGISRIIRKLGFTNNERKRLIDRVNKTVDSMRGLDKQAVNFEKRAEATRSDEQKKELRKQVRSIRADLERMEGDAGANLRRTQAHPARDRAGRRRCRVRQARTHRGQPAPRGFDRQEVHQSRTPVPRPHSGRQHRPDEGGGQVRIPPRLQVLDLRDVVDPSGHHSRHRRPGAHHPYSGAHDRDHQQAHPHLASVGAGTRSRAYLGRDRQAHGHPGGQGAQGAEDRAGADFAGDADRRGRRFPPWATSSKIAPWFHRPKP